MSALGNFCPCCRGAGNVGVYPLFWQCAPCGGSGVLVQHGPRYIRTGGKKA